MNKLSKRSVMNSVFTLLVVGVVIAGLGSVAALTSPESDSSESRDNDRVLSVTAMRARFVSGYTVERQYVGRVEARQESRVGFELSGLVIRVSADEGQQVEAGQVIANLNTEHLEVQLQALQGRRDELVADIGLARATRIRQEELAEKSHASQQAFDQARFNEQSILGRLRQLDAEIASIELNVRKSALKAPFEALVSTRFIDEGLVISAGEPVFELLEANNPEVRIGLVGDAIDGVDVGQQHELLIRGRTVPATIRSVLPVRQRDTRGVDVVFSLHVPLNGIRRGDLARLFVERHIEESGFWLPLSALSESVRGLWAVYVVQGSEGESGRLERREIEVLHLDAERVFVRGTLANRERVIVAGTHRLVPDQWVRIAKLSDTQERVVMESSQ